jgi:hypothetical protein
MILLTDSSEGRSSVFVAASDGSSRLRLTDPKILARDPIWLANSGQIAFSAIDHHDRKVFVMDSDGTSPRIVSPPRYQQCAPDSAPLHTNYLLILCGRAPYMPPSRGLFFPPPGRYGQQRSLSLPCRLDQSQIEASARCRENLRQSLHRDLFPRPKDSKSGFSYGWELKE